MTKQCTAFSFLLARPVAAARLLVLLLALPGAQAQGLRPSAQVRMPELNASPRVPAPSTQADFIVAVVNSEPITNNELRGKVLRMEQQMQQQGTELPPHAELVRQMLERMIGEKAQLQLAKNSGIKIDDNAVAGAVQGIASQNQITVDELRRRLSADGISYSQFESELRSDLLVSRLRQRELESRSSVSEKEIDKYQQEQSTSAGAAPTRINLGEILVAVPENATPAQVAVAQAKAQTIMERARAGADFTALVNEFSQAPSRSTGGLLGSRETVRYPQLFVDATQSLQIGAFAGPVRSGAGFHILKVVEKKQGNLPDASITQTHARHILLRITPQLSEAAAIEKLAGFKKRIDAKQADFAALARENSDDGSAKDGGDLGWANSGMFVPEFEKVMNALAPQQISDPLVSRFGVHLLQVLERRETQLSIREQREVVRNLLREKKQEEAFAAWAQEVRGRAYVEYRDPPK